MQFLIDEDLPRSTGNLLRLYGHEAIDVRDIGLRGASSLFFAYGLGHPVSSMASNPSFVEAVVL